MVLDLVTQTDLEQLLDCPDDPSFDEDHKRKYRKRAYEILEDIFFRLPRPRAYLIEPTALPNRQHEALLWSFGTDLLTAQLHEEKIGVIDPLSLRALLVFCPILYEHIPRPDVLWPVLVATDMLDRVYIPHDGRHNKRHQHASERATAHDIEVYTWQLAFDHNARS
jgi:hypothetical protein